MSNSGRRILDFPKNRSRPVNGGSGNGGDLRERLARLEERVNGIKENMATKGDVKDVKIWVLSGVLGGVLGGMVLAAGTSIAIMKLFF